MKSISRTECQAVPAEQLWLSQLYKRGQMCGFLGVCSFISLFNVLIFSNAERVLHIAVPIKLTITLPE